MIDEHFHQTLQGARVGAEWAWTAIYQDLAPAVLGYLRARGAVDAEDLAGEVFLQIVRDLCSFDGGEREFRAWVFVIAHHRLLDERRRRERRPVDSAAEVAAERVSPDAEEEALRGVSDQRVLSVLAQVAPDQRAVLLLRIVGQLTIEEVSRVVGKGPGAVKALQRRGLRAVERALVEEGVPL